MQADKSVLDHMNWPDGGVHDEGKKDRQKGQAGDD
jgi:hypothetical protein